MVESIFSSARSLSSIVSARLYSFSACMYSGCALIGMLFVVCKYLNICVFSFLYENNFGFSFWGDRE